MFIFLSINDVVLAVQHYTKMPFFKLLISPSMIMIHYIELSVILLNFSLIIWFQQKMFFKNFCLLYTKNPEKNKIKVLFITSHLLILTTFIAVILFYMSLLQKVNPMDNLIIMDRDFEFISNVYPDFAEKVQFAQWRMHNAFFQILWIQSILCIALFYCNSYIYNIFLIVLFFLSAYSDLNVLIDAQRIMDTPFWTPSGHINPNIIKHHQKNIRFSRYTLGKVYTSEELLQMAEDYIQKQAPDRINITVPYKYWGKKKHEEKFENLVFDELRTKIKIELAKNPRPNSYKALSRLIENIMRPSLSSKNLLKLYYHYVNEYHDKKEYYNRRPKRWKPNAHKKEHGRKWFRL